MNIDTLPDYFDAVEERQRLEALVELGRKDFSGYGLELFERGFHSKIQKLTDEIDRYEIQSGYSAACDSFRLATRSVIWQCNVSGGLFIDTGSFANYSNCSTGLATFNVQMIYGRIDEHVGMHVKATPLPELPESSVNRISSADILTPV